MLSVLRMDITLFFTIFLCAPVLGSLKKPGLRLERVVIEYYDPKYLDHPVTFTSRSKRGDTYKTNVTVGSYHAWGNNVTVIIYYKNSESNIEHELITARICDALKLQWIVSLFQKYTDIPTKCDVPPGIYHITNMELSPKNFPLATSLPPGEHFVGLMFVLTKNRQVIIKYRGTIHVFK